MAAKTHRQKAVRPQAKGKSAVSRTKTPNTIGNWSDEQFDQIQKLLLRIGDNCDYKAGYVDGQREKERRLTTPH
jgi:valyl-tRNA synthetase